MHMSDPASECSNKCSSDMKIAKPFVKWAGGKGKIAADLAKLVPPYIGRRSDRRYIEPFAGGAALFFALASAGLESPGDVGMRNVQLSDANADLMSAFAGVRNNVDSIVSDLRWHAKRHAESGKSHYYELRSAWNEMADRDMAFDRAPSSFIYLNRACFNGLWRVNKDGRMNTPYGDRVVKPEDVDKDNAICDETNLRACSRVLQGVGISSGDYTDAVKDVRPGDFVYFDSPYDGTFSSYTADGFGEDAQRELAFVSREIVKAGARVMISNSDTELIREIYGMDDFKIGMLPVHHSMAASGKARKKVNELVICGGGVRDWQQTSMLL